MFIKLMNNDVSAGRFQYITKALKGILTGAITSPSQLDAGFFLQSQSKFVSGSYPAPGYWTSLYDLTTSASSGSVILSKASSIVGKNNFLRISYDASYIYFSTGTAFATNTLTNLSSTVTILNAGWEFKPIYLRFADTFVHCFNQTTASNLTTTGLGVEITNNPYDAYSQEAAFKLLDFTWQYNALGLTLSLIVSNMFAPSTQTYTSGSTTLTPPYNITTANTDEIETTRGENLRDNQLLLVPIIFNKLSTGWLGANISELTGLYLCSNHGLMGEEFVTVDGVTYACANINRTYPTDALMLFKV